MERQQLKETLIALHNELSASQEEVDQETQGLLKQLSDDIDRLCEPAEEAEPVETVDSEQKEGMIDQLMHLTDQFEASHPQLAETIGRVAAALSRIGI